MPIITGRTALSANQQTNNILEGSSFEFLEADSIIRLLMVNESPGNDDVQAFFSIGGVILIQPPFGLVYAPGALLADNKGAIYTDPLIPNDVAHPYIVRTAPAGARLFLSLNNTGGGTPAVRWTVRIDGP